MLQNFMLRASKNFLDTIEIHQAISVVSEVLFPQLKFFGQYDFNCFGKHFKSYFIN